MTLLSVGEASQKHGYSKRHVRRLAEFGVVPSEKIGAVWAIDDAGLRAYRRYEGARKAGVMSLISVTEAADRYGLSAPHIRRLVSDGVLKGTMFGKTWVLNERSLKAYLAKERRRGPKPKRR